MDEDQRHEQAAEAHNDPESTKPIEHQEAGPIQEQASYQNYNAEKSRRALTRYEFVSVLIQGGVFLVTSIYALLVFLQWRAMNATLNVAKETVDLSKRSLEITKRPWVVLTKVTIETPLAPERGMQVRAFLKNTGETP